MQKLNEKVHLTELTRKWETHWTQRKSLLCSELAHKPAMSVDVMAVIKCALSPLTSSTIQSQRKKSPHGTAASVFPDVKVLLVSQATHSEYAFTSFYLDADLVMLLYIWLRASSQGFFRLRIDLYKHEDTRLCSATAAQWKHQINMLLCSEGQTDQAKESDRVKGQCSSASLPDLSDRGGFLVILTDSCVTAQPGKPLSVGKISKDIFYLFINKLVFSQSVYQLQRWS